jgi:hypothetical protein
MLDPSRNFVEEAYLCAQFTVRLHPRRKPHKIVPNEIHSSTLLQQQQQPKSRPVSVANQSNKEYLLRHYLITQKTN